MIGVILCFISWIILGITIILNNYNRLLKALWIVLALLQYTGFVSFLANIIQYNIDQLIGASANELSTVIYWNIAAYPTATALSDWLSSLDTVTEELLFIMASGVALSLILVSHSFFKHKLENISLIKNPIKLIFRVLCYTRKHKYPENRSALTYWEEEAPSRIDLGKDKYGGPFTEEEVEDVKTFFRILPLFIATFGYALAEDSFFEKSSNYYKVLKSFGAYHITVLLLFLIYLFIIRGFFHRYIPSMLSRMGAGLFFSLSTCILHLLTEKFQSYHNLLIIIEQVIFGISFFLLFPTSFEFTVAQSPEHMRGLMVGLCYSSMGFGSAISKILLTSIKKWYYYIIACVLQLLILIIFLILAKRYKYRVRENEINIVQIVDDHYQKYMEQENEHWQQRKFPQDY
uniref:Major facilitator superfamily (MFS) profile domain-containing protein n=1 Tax=Amphimedon queenslandica TaxID=400682 RepID=A0A1X7V6G7_AMPQE